MKTELRTKHHDILLGQTVVELWHEGEFIGCLYGADGPGFRLITRHPFISVVKPDEQANVFEVTIICPKSAPTSAPPSGTPPARER